MENSKNQCGKLKKSMWKTRLTDRLHIKTRINSLSGYVHSSIAIYEAVRQIKKPLYDQLCVNKKTLLFIDRDNRIMLLQTVKNQRKDSLNTKKLDLLIKKRELIVNIISECTD